MDNLTEPLMEEALRLAKMNLELSKGVDAKDNDENDNLLAHLVRHTQDMNILKDELVNLLVAGRETEREMSMSSIPVPLTLDERPCVF